MREIGAHKFGGFSCDIYLCLSLIKNQRCLWCKETLLLCNDRLSWISFDSYITFKDLWDFSFISSRIIKILQEHLCSQWYLAFTAHFSLFYLFDWKFSDLIFFFVARQNVRAWKIGPRVLRARMRLIRSIKYILENVKCNFIN